jgi:hypothetical protein
LRLAVKHEEKELCFSSFQVKLKQNKDEQRIIPASDFQSWAIASRDFLAKNRISPATSRMPVSLVIWEIAKSINKSGTD